MKRKEKKTNSGRKGDRGSATNTPGSFARSQPFYTVPNISHNAGGFPETKRVTLMYTTLSNHSSSTVTGDDYVWSGNGVFDPDITSAGVQPANYDDWTIQYNRYRVLSSTIVVNFSTNGTSNLAQQMLITLGPRPTATTVTTLAGAQDFATNFDCQSHLTSSQSGGIKSMSATMQSWRQLGVSKAEYMADDQYSAVYTANPALQWYWHFASQGADQTTTCPIYFHVVISYDVVFFQRNATILDLDTAMSRRALLREATIKKNRGRKPQQMSGKEFRKRKLRDGEEMEDKEDIKSTVII